MPRGPLPSPRDRWALQDRSGRNRKSWAFDLDARCIAGAVAAEKLIPVSAVGRILSTPIVQVSLTSGGSLFFDMIRRVEFIALFPLSGGAAPPRQ
jgi:hypothetical protein